MELDEILRSLFPYGHAVAVEGALLLGHGIVPGGTRADVIGIAGRAPLGVDEAVRLSAYLIDALSRGGNGPVLVLVDSGSQRMSKRDELMGLSEFLAHLAKVLVFADQRGRPTVGILFGHSAAGAFIATALATRCLVALPGAHPAVMDLPSMARVTKLPLRVLEEKARTTPVFAPGLDNLAQTGAVLRSWDPARSLADQLLALLRDEAGNAADRRDALGRSREGRLKAADVAEAVMAQATGRS